MLLAMSEEVRPMMLDVLSGGWRVASVVLSMVGLKIQKSNSGEKEKG